MSDPTINRPTAVPVVSRTPNQQLRRTLAEITVVIGFIAITLQKAMPDLVHAFPGATWIPSAVVTLGILARALQSASDGRNLTVVSQHIEAAPMPDVAPVAPVLPAGAVSVAPILPRPMLPEEAELDTEQNQTLGE